MTKKKITKRLFGGMGYREVQRSNSNRRSQLPKPEQKWLKANGYKNLGWDNVIRLYQKINDLLASSATEEPTLEELFLKADAIGNKYQSSSEIEAFHQSLRAEVENISELVDQQFPDSEVEHVDYSQKSVYKRRKRAKH